MTHSKAQNAGFTLIELLVVVAIIGILAAVAIPQYAQYRQRSFDAQALSDLRNAANAEEAYYSTRFFYIPCSDEECETNLPAFTKSDSVTITIAVVTGDNPSFTGEASSVSGSTTYIYDSEAGGIQF